jgi:hypothetical protein
MNAATTAAFKLSYLRASTQCNTTQLVVVRAVKAVLVQRRCCCAHFPTIFDYNHLLLWLMLTSILAQSSLGQHTVTACAGHWQPLRK